MCHRCKEPVEIDEMGSYQCQKCGLEQVYQKCPTCGAKMELNTWDGSGDCTQCGYEEPAFYEKAV